MLEIRRIAPLSSVQDGGRGDWRALGVPQSGPLDAWSHAVANVLVGNDPDAAAIEIGFGRSLLRFTQPALIAITGARTASGSAVWVIWRMAATLSLESSAARRRTWAGSSAAPLSWAI